LVHADAASYLADYPFSGSELVYADPPYLPASRRRARVYRHDYGFEQHLELLEVLKRIHCQVMISGYDSALYNISLKSWRKVTFNAKTHVGSRQECVWMNFDSATQLHDASYLGDSFRDRQTIRRRHTRLLGKFERMAPTERSHVLTLLNERWGGALFS